jgi:hypothetical protein
MAFCLGCQGSLLNAEPRFPDELPGGFGTEHAEVHVGPQPGRHDAGLVAVFDAQQEQPAWLEPVPEAFQERSVLVPRNVIEGIQGGDGVELPSRE